MLKKIFAGLFCVTLSVSIASADEAAIKHNLQTRFPGAEVQNVAKTPVKGIYEVIMEGRLIYVDENADYLFVGNLVDAKSQRNLTEERMRQLLKVDFDALPLDLAIKIVKGNGKRRMAVFSDPDCPFCHKLEKDLQSVTNVTIYTFLYPIAGLHPAAGEKAKAIWCAPDRAKAWNDFMQQGKLPKGVACETPIEKIAELGRKLRVTGTPTIIFADGRMVPGAVPAAQLEQLLGAVQK
jgi:thiol:disulfide interchange protein DsbC